MLNEGGLIDVQDAGPPSEQLSGWSILGGSAETVEPMIDNVQACKMLESLAARKR